MTQEEKAKAYDKAIEKIKYVMEHGVSPTLNKEDLQDIFPELAESEDEKIRKAILDHLTLMWGNSQDDVCGVHVEDAIAWLEKRGEKRKITHEEICKSYGIPDIGEFSDGYHTFNGLYKQRMILFAVLVKTYKDMAWKSWKHEDGLDCFGGGWFIVGIDTPAGTYTYHYEAKDWDRFDCQILEKAKHWDGHDEFDVERLFSLVSNVNNDEVRRCLINGMKFYYKDNEEATWGTEKFHMKVKDILAWLEKKGKKKEINPTLQEKERMDDAFTKMMLKPQVDGFDAELNALLKKYEHLSKKELQEPLEFYLDVIRNENPNHHEGWVNVFRGKNGYYVDREIWEFEENANTIGKEFAEYITSVKVEWEEQQ